MHNIIGGCIYFIHPLLKVIARPNPVLAQPPSGSAESSWSENTDSLLEKYAFHVGAGSEEDMSLQQRVGGQDWSRSPNLAVFDAVPQDQALSL